MIVKENISLLPYNTFGIDIKSKYFVEYSSEADLIDLLAWDLFKENQFLHIGMGSNLLFLEDFRGLILHSAIKHIVVEYEDETSVNVRVGAGVVWDDFVAYCVARGWVGAENLSLIPGEVGAAAVQNIGAYGVEVKDIILSVRTLELKTAMVREFSQEQCAYSYRESVFKNAYKGRCIVTDVLFKLEKRLNFHLKYQHLENEVLSTGEISLTNIRKTIIRIRESKLPDTKVLGNAGSFFMNPVVPKDQFCELLLEYPSIPHYYASETSEKLSAAWLIDQCGWKGKSLGPAGVHENQALVLINKGGASGMDIVRLAEEIQKSVKEKFKIELNPEVNYIGG